MIPQQSTSQKETADAQGAFGRAFNVPENNHATEKSIAKHNWRMIVIGEHEAEKIAENSEVFAEAFKGDCFVFETQGAHDTFFQKAHPINASKVSLATLGVIENNAASSKSDGIFSRVDCIVCIGHVQSKILGELKKASKQVYTDPIDLYVIATEKQKLSTAQPAKPKQRNRVIGG